MPKPILTVRERELAEVQKELSLMPHDKAEGFTTKSHYQDIIKATWPLIIADYKPIIINVC